MPRRDSVQTTGRPKTGRPSALTPERRTVIITALARGQHISTACGLAGVSTAAFYRWMQRAERVEYAMEHGQPYDAKHVYFRDFRDEVLKARAEAAVTMVDVVFNAAVGGRLIEEKPAVDSKGDPILDADGNPLMERKWSQPNGSLALAYLKVAQPEAWGGSPARLELSGPGGTPLAMGADTDDANADAVSRLAARLAITTRQRAEEEADRQAHEAKPDADGVYDAELVEEP